MGPAVAPRDETTRLVGEPPGLFWTALMVLVVSGLALAPVRCVTSCRDTTDGSDGCLTACDTVFGYPAPLASVGWLVVPVTVLLIGVNIGCQPPLRNGSLDGVLDADEQTALAELLRGTS